MSVAGHLRTNGFMDQKRSDAWGVPALLYPVVLLRGPRWQGRANITKTGMELRGIAVRSGVSQSRIEEKPWVSSAKKSPQWTTCFCMA
jgi:hypothetical protein